jgi:hypothetical protein
MKYFSILLLASHAALAQPPSVQAEWDIARTIQALSQQSARLTPLVEQLNPSDWVAKGASPTFVSQWQTAKLQLGFLTTATQILEKQPEKLTAALDTYFRLQVIETQLRSLADGVRTYQNPAVADLVLSVLGENSANRDRLQQYISDLASQKEQEFSVIDREAQRCRVTVNRQIPTQNPARTTNPAKKPAAKQ